MKYIELETYATAAHQVSLGNHLCFLFLSFLFFQLPTYAFDGKPSQSTSNRLTHAVFPRKTRVPQPFFAVSNRPKASFSVSKQSQKSHF